jgi:hypothetical protein
MAGASDQTIFDLIRKAKVPYALTDPRDRKKVELALNNQPSMRPSSAICQAAWYLAKRDTVGPNPPPPPPPEPTYKKVAPITVREEGGSDQRVCLWTGAMGSSELVPGVWRTASGEYTDESGARYNADGDGLENSSIRPKVDDPRLVGARSMDGRSACQCPPVGDPTKNTGSWAI